MAFSLLGPMDQMAAIMDQPKEPDKNLIRSILPIKKFPNSLLTQTHRELARLYEAHGDIVVAYWKGLDRPGRELVLRNSSICPVLKTGQSPGCGFSHVLGPEWNHEDIINPENNVFLDVLKHRATKSLTHQFTIGANGTQGDCVFTCARFAEHLIPCLEHFDGDVMVFEDCEDYPRTADIVEYWEAIAGVRTDRHLWVSGPVGELIVARQMFWVEILHRALVTILTVLATDRKHPNCTCHEHDKGEVHGNEVLPQLTLTSDSGLRPFINFIKAEEDETIIWAQKLMAKPDILLMEATNYVEDLDRYVAACIFDPYYAAEKDAGTSYYIRVLLCSIHILDNSRKTAKRREFLLQELSNVLHLKFLKLLEFVKRWLQCGKAEKYFKRVPNTYDHLGSEVVVVKDRVIDNKNRKIYYGMQLCKPGLTHRHASFWLTKLAPYYKNKVPGVATMVPEGVEFSEFHTSINFSNLNLLVSFISDLDKQLSLPPVSDTKGQLYISRVNQLEAELATVKRNLDLRRIAPDIDRLAEPLVTSAVRDNVANAIEEKLGTSLPNRYWNLVQSCVDNFPDLGHYESSRVNFDVCFPKSSCQCESEKSAEPAKKKKRKPKKKKPKKVTEESDVLPELDENHDAWVNDLNTPWLSKADGDSSWDELATSVTGSLSLNEPELDLPVDGVSVNASQDSGDSEAVLADAEPQASDPWANFLETSGSVSDAPTTPTEASFGDSLHEDDSEHKEHDGDDDDQDENQHPDEDEQEIMEGPRNQDASLLAKPDTEDGPSTPPQEVIYVSARTATVMATMFDKSLHQGSLTWPEFIAAMVEVGFTADKKKGSAIAFVPLPREDGTSRWKQSIQFHITHGSASSRVEGYRSRKMAHRLTKAFGWNAKTFQIA
ncbi:putative L-asparaginase 3 [Colletotrichum scovillei]|uniref:L-asparaginase 3 n=1 Tax=Colletotrichum scovillei TaxID=1209932 RepID=A0A9P7RBU9_9PEZI|nr:putative L-asparaginase 3 [Colletotrichum scovillei]KAG7071441.1 putative L-asparaginase 3 [Colletotrichum scovillei]KAG7079693.1 putative L-asparaginase 3 [Colletotrichum scovillei]